MSDIRVIERMEVKSCRECPLKEWRESGGSYYCSETGRQLDIPNYNGFELPMFCPLPTKEDTSNRTCLTCKNYGDHTVIDDGFKPMVSMTCEKFDIYLEVDSDLASKFINDTNKHCWEPHGKEL